ncbi:MAG: NAD-dependent epimerase/dehydratase family protein [Parafilimonas sp.]|nr:NAD-dependent epimerase/dehydratase family protein [Parafilimonas sp.]
MKVVVTGASGFIGKRLIEMAKDRYEILPLSLRNNNLSNIDLTGTDVIVHLAGKAHEMKKADDRLFYEINYQLTKNLAEKALEQKIPHFIYISSIKVYGDETSKILNEQSACSPTDAYGKSKLQAEQYLQTVNADKMAVAIIRPPLVYGSEVKGNMMRLLKLSSKKVPLPLANTNNLRSMVFVDNLIELIFTIIEKKAAGIFIAADEKPLSTDVVLQMIKNNLGNNTTLISLPLGARKIVKKLKPGLYSRLFDSLVVDNSETNRLLNFKPPYSTEYGIKKMADWFKAQ